MGNVFVLGQRRNGGPTMGTKGDYVLLIDIYQEYDRNGMQ